MTVLYLDCFSGVSGDMLLGALIDAGVPLADIRKALGSLSSDPDVVWTEQVTRTGISATKFCVKGEDPVQDGSSHKQGHSHVHAHRTLAEISGLIEQSGLTVKGKERATALFSRLADVEASIHGTSLESVYLHEVGALDSIIDIVGAVFAIESLGVDEIVSSSLNLGSGSVQSAHGVYPVPAPATARLLTNVPVYGSTQQAELVTPTGALLVSAYADRYGPVPEMKIRSVGYGAGSRDFPDTPNVVRVLVGENTNAVKTESVVVVECEIDDMNPQIFGVLMDELLAKGALDVFYTSVLMKKGRPGTLVSVITNQSCREEITSLLFRQTTTIGVRYREMTRECLTRKKINLSTPVGEVRFKISSRGNDVMNVSPEFDDVRLIAERDNKPIKDIHAIVMKAYLDRDRTKG